VPGTRVRFGCARDFNSVENPRTEDFKSSFKMKQKLVLFILVLHFFLMQQKTYFRFPVRLRSETREDHLTLIFVNGCV